MELKDIVKRISKESGLSEKDIKERIKVKQGELGGLVTPEGAAHIVANEAGVNLFDGTPRAVEQKVENIIPGMEGVDITGRVMRIYPKREFDKKDGSKGAVSSLVLVDDTGTIRVVFWGKKTDLLENVKEEDIIRIVGGYTRENINGEAEVHIGRNSRIIINPKDVDPEKLPLPEETKKKIAELKEGMPSVDLVCRVVRIYEVREFERDDSTRGRVVNMVVADDTGSARLVLWDEDAGLVEGGKIKEGDAIKVRKGYVKFRFGEPEVNIGKFGKIILNPPEAEVKELPEGVGDLKLTRKRIAELKAGERAEVRGALVDIYDKITIFDRDKGKGMVVNAVIDDGTSSMRAAFYDKMAEALTNINLEKACSGDVSDIVSARIRKILGREVIASGNVRHSDFSGKDELIVNDINMKPDPKAEARRLLEELKEG